jgi:prolipoprotein diacylglyceryltransferase
MEFLRGDRRLQMWGLTAAQVMSIALFAVGLTYLIWSHARERHKARNDK